MAAIEDIPVETLRSGIPWVWQDLASYMDYLDRIPHGIDIGLLIPHGVVRSFVMGEQRSVREIATPEEIAQIAETMREGMRSGALGCSTNHSVSTKPKIIPGTYASDDEFLALAMAVGEFGGVMQTSAAGLHGEEVGTFSETFDLLRRMSAAPDGCPITFSLVQFDYDPEFWRTVISLCEDQNKRAAGYSPRF